MRIGITTSYSTAELFTHDAYNFHISEPVSASAHYDLVSIIVHVAVNRPAMPAWAVGPCGVDPVGMVTVMMMVVAGVKPGSGMTGLTGMAGLTRVTGMPRSRPHCARRSCDHYQC